MRSGPEAFDSADVAALVAAQQRELKALDGSGDIGPTREAAMFEPPDGVFVVLRDDDGAAVACGGICRFDESRAELKRMFVLSGVRGRGHGRVVLEELEAAARRLGYAGIVLETGELQEAALGLYRSAGYGPIPCYGVYASRPWSVCLEKRLSVE